MRQPLFLTLLLAVFFSCKDKEIPPVSSCIGEPAPNFWRASCDNYPIDTSLVCSCNDMGSFKLEASSMECLPLYCKEIGDVIQYVNDKGETLNMVVSNKTYNQYSGFHSAYKTCFEDSPKVNVYHLDYEQLSVLLMSESTNLQLVITIKTIPDLSQHGEGRVGDFLEITRKKSSFGDWAVDLTAVVNQRSLSYHEEIFQEYYEQIELLGKTFNKVISHDVTHYVNSKPFKYYYTAERGLVGFVDQSGVLWRIAN
jgi:hypothetical protein